MGQQGLQLLTGIEKYGELGRDETFSLLQKLKCAYSFSKSTQEVFSMALYKHVTHYGPGSDFPHCNMTAPSTGLLLSEDAMSSYVCLRPGKFKRYTEYDYLILCRIGDKSKIYQIMYGGCYCLFNLFHSHKLIFFYFYFQHNSVDKENIKNM